MPGHLIEVVNFQPDQEGKSYTQALTDAEVESSYAPDHPVDIPPGFGFKTIAKDRWHASAESADPLRHLMTRLLIWETPMRTERYVLSCDVSDGIGKDRSCIDVLRVGTVQRPTEQVAQFITDEIEPMELAYYIDAIGRFYSDGDGLEALASIETNNHGISTQNELQMHLGYSNFFVWHRFDVAPKFRQSHAIGWETNARSRRIIIPQLIKALKSYMADVGDPDIIVNSPFTIAEMQDFSIPPEPGASIVDARAPQGLFDDALMTLAIGLYAVTSLFYDEREPLSDQRRRHAEEKARREELATRSGARVDFQNTDATVDEMNGTDDGYFA
jgi:hypothetical protein